MIIEVETFAKIQLIMPIQLKRFVFNEIIFFLKLTRLIIFMGRSEYYRTVVILMPNLSLKMFRKGI